MSDYNQGRRSERPSENSYENFYRRGNYESNNPSYEDETRRGYSSYGDPELYRSRRQWDEERYNRPYYGSEGNFSGSNFDRDYEFSMNRRGYSGSSYPQYGTDYRNNPANLGVGSNYAYNRGGFGSDFGGEYGRYGREYGPTYGGEFGEASYSPRGRGWGFNDPNREYSSYRGRYDRDYEKRWQRDNRDWFDKAGDEVASWFGDEDAERRRRLDKAEGQFRGRGPKGYRRSDSRIEEDINDRLSDDGWVDASDIECKVNNGEVILSGNVNDRFSKRRAEDIAESVSGVANVENHIHVRQESYTQAASYRRDISSGKDGLTGSSDSRKTRTT